MGRSLLLAIFLLAGVFLAGTGYSLAEGQAPVLDLSHEHHTGKDGLNLSLTWEIYWKQLLGPDELEAARVQPTTVLSFETMSADEGLRIDGKVQKQGFATMRTRFRLPAHTQPLTLYVPRMGTPYRLWIDGQLVAEIGEFDRNGQPVKNVLRAVTATLRPGSGEHELVMQAVNKDNSYIGPIRMLRVFEPARYESFHRSSSLTDMFLVGAILLMSFYHFALFWIRRSELAPLYFGLFCLVVGMRTLLMSDGFTLVLENSIGIPPFEWVVRIEYLAFTLGVVFFNRFVTNLYPNEIPKFVKPLILYPSIAYSVLIVLTLPIIYNRPIHYYEVLAISSCFVYVYALLLAIKRKREGAVIFVLGFMLLTGALVNDILMGNRIIVSVTLIPVALFTFVFFQAIILSKRFAKAFEQVKIAEAEIRTLNDALELKVVERTRTIRTILDNVRSGFLMIDSKGHVAEGFTKSCLEILGPDVAAGKPLEDLLRLSHRDSSLLQQALSQVFADVMPEDVTLAQIPSRYPMGIKVVAIQGSLVRSANGEPEALLLSIFDATQLVKVEEESRRNQSLLKIISEKSSFRAFIKDSLESLTSCSRLIESRNQSEVAMVLHTLKGNFALYGLEPIAAFIHEIEEKPELSKLDIRAIIQTVEEFINFNGTILGIDSNRLEKENYDVSGDSLARLEAALEAANASRPALQALHNWVREVRMVPVRELLGPIEANVERVAQALGKHVNFQMVGADLKVDPERMRSPFKNIIHAVINSIDHGIEYPEERGSKDPTGSVRLTFSYDELAYLKVKVEDDGRGLDLQLIRRHALEKKLLKPEELSRLSEVEIQALIFRQGFSTKRNVSEFSGRGVGIAALDYAVQSLGGQIRVSIVPGKGTQIDISIPTEQTLELLTGIA